MESEHPVPELRTPPAAPPEDGRRIRPSYSDPDPSAWPKTGSFLSLDFISRKRLGSALPIYFAELRHLELRAASRREEDLVPSIDGARTLLNRAKEALHQKDADHGWQCLHSAQRMLLPVLEKLDPEYFRVVARAVHHEAKAKLSSWRKETVLDALGRDDKDRAFREDVSSPAVAAAMLILHEHFGNVYHKVYDSQRQLRILTVILFVAAVAFMVLWPFIEWGSTAAGGAQPTSDAEGIVSSISLSGLAALALFGAMGACVSGIRQLAVGATSGKIPERLVAAWVTLTRPIVGAVAAMVLYFFFTGGIFPVINVEAGYLESALAVAFAAGFSEQLVWRAAERLTDKKS